jgi:hypothetical protein
MKRFSIFSTISMTTMMTTMLGALGLFYAGQANAWTHSVRVATTDGLIAAMLEAERTHESTEISVAPGHYLFTQVFNSSYGGNALPNVTTEILIVGEDPTTTIFDLGGRDLFVPRFFTVLPTGNLELRNLTLTGAGSYGACQGSPENCVDMGGGAVLNIHGVLTIKSSILSGNQTYSGVANGAEFDQLDGGAIESVGGILTIVDSTIEGNYAEGSGGGIALHGGSASISHSMILGNSVIPGAIFDGSFFGLIGGGIFVASGEMTIDSSTISGNAAGIAGALEQSYSVWGLGGGIYNAGSLLLTNSAVINNSVVDYGGGAGIYNADGMKIENSTVALNVAGSVGGGIFNAHDLILQGVTLTENNALGNVAEALYDGQLPIPAYPPGCGYGGSNCDLGGSGLHSDPGANTQVATSVLANNNGSDCSGVVVSDGRNALGTNSGCTWTKSPSLQGHSTYDQINIDPLLGTFSDDGVAGNAHYPLLPGSPAIDAGGAVGTYCTLLDQLGHRRVAASGNPDAWSICDLGAIEYRR